MTIKVTEALDMDTAEIVVIERPSTSGSYVEGIWVEGASETFKALASVQQPTPQELEMLSEGDRDKDLRKFISSKPLNTSRDKDGVQADTILYDGKRYLVIGVADWSNFGHSSVIGARTDA